MREIPLTQGQVALVDDEDFERVNQYKWHTSSNSTNQTLYAARNICKKLGVWRLQYLHRFILNTPNGLQVDHKDHNGLNNTKANIRNVTRTENNRNGLKCRKITSSKYRGVGWHKKCNNWRAYIGIAGKHIHLGHYETELEAALAYDEKAHEVDSQHYLCNFPIPVSAA